MENEKARARRLMNNFKLTIPDWELINRFQNSLCFLCQTRPKSGQRLATDHSHHTGLVRGLLCNHCNKLLGKIENVIAGHPARAGADRDPWTVVILTRLIEYLSNPPATQALGRMVIGYAGRIGTKRQRATLKREKKLAAKKEAV
jgi:hypothetical protein